MSDQVVWEVVKNNSCFLVNRPQGGGARFSTDPLNLANKHSYKYSGSTASQAIGIQPASSGKGITVLTKNSAEKTGNKPTKNVTSVTYAPRRSRGTISKSITNITEKGYRPDLTSSALARASQILKMQRAKAGTRTLERKPRGKKAAKAE